MRLSLLCYFAYLCMVKCYLKNRCHKNHRKTLLTESFWACKVIKKRLEHRFFPVNFAIFSRTLFSRTPAASERFWCNKVLLSPLLKGLLLKHVPFLFWNIVCSLSNNFLYGMLQRNFCCHKVIIIILTKNFIKMW